MHGIELALQRTDRLMDPDELIPRQVQGVISICPHGLEAEDRVVQSEEFGHARFYRAEARHSKFCSNVFQYSGMPPGSRGTDPITTGQS
ncbi:hypothetical protein ACYX8G_17040 [Microbacterium saperdae]